MLRVKEQQLFSVWLFSAVSRVGPVYLFQLLVSETVELDDELAVSGRDLGTGIDDLDDVQLFSQAHLCAHFPTQVLDVLHLCIKSQITLLLQQTDRDSARWLNLTERRCGSTYLFIVGHGAPGQFIQVAMRVGLWLPLGKQTW